MRDAGKILPERGVAGPTQLESSYSTASYEGGGAVPEKVVINITVQARPTPPA